MLLCFSAKNAEKCAAAVKVYVRHSKPTWPERMIDSLALSQKRAIGFLFVVYCAVGKSRFSLMHISQRRRNLLLVQSVFLLEGRRGGKRAVNPVCWGSIRRVQRQATKALT